MTKLGLQSRSSLQTFVKGKDAPLNGNSKSIGRIEQITKGTLADWAMAMPAMTMKSLKPVKDE